MRRQNLLPLTLCHVTRILSAVELGNYPPAGQLLPLVGAACTMCR
jgi:hypothetical protein